MSQLRIKDAKPLKGFLVKVELTDGTTRTIDVGCYLCGPIFKKIKEDPNFFCQVKADHGTLMWPNGADLCPDVLLGNEIARRVVARFKQAMPSICQFKGASIYVYPNDHPPPHIHVRKDNKDAEIEILTGKIIAGKLTVPLHKIVRKWLKEQQIAISRAYIEAQAGRVPEQVPPPK